MGVVRPALAAAPSRVQSAGTRQEGNVPAARSPGSRRRRRPPGGAAVRGLRPPQLRAPLGLRPRSPPPPIKLSDLSAAPGFPPLQHPGGLGFRPGPARPNFRGKPLSTE